MSCPECKKDFDNAARSPILGKCVHSVCAACAFNPVSGRSIDCPICEEEYAFKDRIGNYQMIEILGNMDDAIRAKKEVRKEQMLEEYLESKKLLKCFDCGCIVEIEQGRVCITCYGPTINYGVSQGYMYITDPVNLEEVKRRVLCAGCFFEGRHRECEGFANLPWLQVKYSSEISLQSTALEKVAKESRKRMKEDIVRLTGSLKEVDMLYLKLVAKLQNATGDAVFQLEDLVEKFRKETEILKKIESDFAEQALEHAANLNNVTRTMKKIINPNPVEEYDEFPKDRKQLNSSIPERRFYKSEYDDSDSESTKY